MTAYEEAVSEVRTGPLSILSPAAQDRILALMSKVAQDAYWRGELAEREAALHKRRTW